MSCEGSKEEIEKNYEDYLEIKEEKVRDYFFLVGGSKDANAQCDDVKNQKKDLMILSLDIKIKSKLS